MKVNHPFIESLKVYRMDSVVFVEDMPELYEIYGKPVDLNFRVRQGEILLEQNSPEYFAIFSAWHTIKALNFYKKHFNDLVNFEEEEDFKQLKIYLGEFINCNPREYVFNPNARISPTTIYHEAGHRAFCQIDDKLPIGNVSTLLHNGLLEYFTASIADYPVVGEGFLPDRLTRDLSKSIRYPEDLYYYTDFMEDFYASYQDTLSYGKATRRLFELNKRRAERCTDTILMTHQSGLLIAHPLWEIRQEVGAEVMDSLVVSAMKLLPDLVKRRDLFLSEDLGTNQEHAEWPEFLHALYQADSQLYDSRHLELIRQKFKNTGFQVGTVKMPAL
jgi:hypothetical protein